MNEIQQFQLTAPERLDWLSTVVAKLNPLTDEGIAAGCAAGYASKAAKAYIAEFTEVTNDNRWSEEGKAQHLEKIKAAAQKQFTAAEKEAARLLAMAEKLEAGLQAPEPADKLLHHAILKEVRERLATLSDQEAGARYWHEINNGRFGAIVEALESDPLPRSFITEQSRDATRKNRMLAEHPDAAAKSKKIRDSHDALQRYFKGVSKLLA